MKISRSVALVAALGVWLGMCVTPSGADAARTAKPDRVLILPLTINAEKDLSFLQTGIFDMLATRLSAEGDVVTIGRDEALQALAAAPNRSTNRAHWPSPASWRPTMSCSAA